MLTGSRSQSASVLLTMQERRLRSSIAAVREWICDVTEGGSPRFTELGWRLLPLRELLVCPTQPEPTQHASSIQGSSAPRPLGETSNSAARNLTNDNATGEHHGVMVRQARVLEQLDILITRLQRGEPAFSSWQDAVQQVEWIFLEVFQLSQMSPQD